MMAAIASVKVANRFTLGCAHQLHSKDARVAAFAQGLALLGWTIGRNVQIDTRWAAADADRIRSHAAELVALAPDVILTSGNAGVAPLLQASRTVPIVFAIVPERNRPHAETGRGNQAHRRSSRRR
jgi:putative ABC transport system substrate-binding protein